MSPLVLSGDRENPTFLAAVAGIPCRLDKLAPRTTFSRTLCALHCFSVEIEKVFFRENIFFLPKKKVSPWYQLVFLIPIFFWTLRISYRAFCSKKTPWLSICPFFQALLNHHGKWRTRNNKRREFKVDCPSTLLHLLIWRISWCRKGQIDNEDYGQ